jgi:hypothetical protein
MNQTLEQALNQAATLLLDSQRSRSYPDPVEGRAAVKELQRFEINPITDYLIAALEDLLEVVEDDEDY